MNSTRPDTEIEQATLRSRNASTSNLSAARSTRRGLRAFFPAFPPRRTCLMKEMLAALHAAELAAWQASGGDFLCSMHQPIA